MSVYPCSICKKRKPGKMASAYWAWFETDQSRTAYKLRYCLADAASSLSLLLAGGSPADNSPDVFACISCGINTDQDSDPIYCTLYLPGKEPMEYALQLCGACAVKWRAPLIDNGDPLGDRGGVVRGPSLGTSGWDALGLTPTGMG